MASDEEIRTTALKYALQNALFFQGRADQKAVMGKVMSSNPEFRKMGKVVLELVGNVCLEVNSLSRDEQERKLGDIDPAMLVREKKERDESLPELKGDTSHVVMRLAPYPSGPLHIGNARMVVLNDEYTKRYKGKLVLVYDDTIGSLEKFPTLEAYDMIKSDLEWLGVDIASVEYKSKRIERFYEMATKLIERGDAYVCFCKSDDLRALRESGTECGHRGHSVDENRKLWDEMLSGKYSEGEAILRFKTDMKHKNPGFRDRTLFRIAKREHPLVGSKYHVWPLLELSWAVDDIELGFTHILRGKDLWIEDWMELEIWKRLGTPAPQIVHYGMMRFKDVKLSKSKSRAEIADGTYTGADDPRTWSMKSLERRGILPKAVRNFVLSFGMSLNDIEVPIENLYSENRKLIDKDARRYFFVRNPVEVEISGLPSQGHVDISNHPENDELGKRQLTTSSRVSITLEDVEANMGGNLRLKDFCNIKLTDTNRAEFISYENMDIPKVLWVCKGVPVEVLMPDGKTVAGLGEENLAQISPGKIIQFERFGFVCPNAFSDGKLTAYFAHK